MARIKYINKNVPDFQDLPCAGNTYELSVPDTLDLQDRADLAVNGLTGPTDPQADYEIYFFAFFNTNPPLMQHDSTDMCQAELLEPLSLMRLMTGSSLNTNVDRRWMEVLHLMQGPDGLLYFPTVGRPWFQRMWHTGFGPGPTGDQYAIPWSNGSYLTAIALYYALSKADVWKSLGQNVVQGLAAAAVDRGSYAYFTKYIYNPGEAVDPAAPIPTQTEAIQPGFQAGWAIQGLVKFYRVTGYDPALDLAAKLSRYLVEHSNVFSSRGQFLDNAHFHAHTYCLVGLLEYALITGDEELMQFVRRGYEFGKADGEPLVGWFPEAVCHRARDFQGCESCCVADMINLAIKLTEAGVGDYFDDADRWIRNQLAENQLTTTDWIDRLSQNEPPTPVDETYQTADRVTQRALGAFAGFAAVNDWWAKIIWPAAEY